MKLIKSNFGTLAGCLLAVVAMFFTASLGTSAAAAQAPAAGTRQVGPTMETRSAFATRFENQLRRRGIDAHVQLAGDERDVLRVEWQTIRRNDIFAFVNSSLVRSAAPSIGFKSIVFSNGEQQWDYDMARESMVLHPVQF
jgi:hypothetical protein